MNRLLHVLYSFLVGLSIAATSAWISDFVLRRSASTWLAPKRDPLLTWNWDGGGQPAVVHHESPLGSAAMLSSSCIDPPDYRFYVSEVGWPARSLLCTGSFTGTSFSFSRIQPIWPGLFLNGLLFAAGIGVLLMCRLVRLRYRRAHNLCPSCAYPIGRSPLCTECGYSFT